MNNRFLWFLLATMLTVGCNRCKDECDDPTNPECPNYDPCLTMSAPNVRIFASGYEALDNDTLWCLSSMLFEPTVDIDSAHWIVGSDPTVHRTTSLNYYFGAPFELIEIRCITFRTDQFGCTNDIVIADTITKHITLVHWNNLPIWSWEFEGAFDDAPNAMRHVYFQIAVDPNSPPNLPFGEQYVLGLRDGCPTEGDCYGFVIDGYNHRKVTPQSSCCWDFGISSGTGYVSLDKQSLYFNFNSSEGWKTFRGKRTN